MTDSEPQRQDCRQRGGDPALPVRRFQIAVNVAKEKDAHGKSVLQLFPYQFPYLDHPSATSGQKPLPEREAGWRHKLLRVFSKFGTPVAPRFTLNETPCTTLLR